MKALAVTIKDNKEQKLWTTNLAFVIDGGCQKRWIAKKRWIVYHVKPETMDSKKYQMSKTVDTQKQWIVNDGMPKSSDTQKERRVNIGKMNG